MDKAQLFAETFKRLKIIFGALILGQCLFLAVIVFGQPDTASSDPQSIHEIFYILVPAIAVLSMSGARILYSKMARESSNKTFEEKLAQFQQASILRWACIEAPGLLSLIAYLLIKENIYLIYWLIILAVFMLFRPSEIRFKEDFNEV